eukprot:gene2394-2626_t
MDWMEQCEKLQNLLVHNRLERERQASTIQDLLLDQRHLHEKISAMMEDQRTVKNHWLAEKADLQSRLFQVQALNTQYLGSMKKKEKDYEKLQNHLAKVIKDIQKTPKASATLSSSSTSTTSSSSSTTTSSSSSTLMTTALKKNLSQDQTNPIVQQLLKDAEVQALKSRLKGLEKENTFFRETITQLEGQVATLQTQVTETLLALPQQQQEEEQEEEEGVVVVVERSTATAVVAVPQTPQAPTPAMRTCGTVMATPSFKVSSLQKKLSEALVVIQEQDRLIRQALLGQLPTTEEGNGNNSKALVWESEEDLDLDLENEVPSNQQQPFDIDALMNMKDSDFLPPASPETLEVLQAFGWASIPLLASVHASRRSSFRKSFIPPSIPEECAPEKLEF